MATKGITDSGKGTGVAATGGKTTQTTGSLFVVQVEVKSATTSIPVITDTYGNTWTRDTTLDITDTGTVWQYTFYKQNGAGGVGHVITATNSAKDMAVFLSEGIGCATTGGPSAHNGAGNSFASSLSTGSITVGAGDFISSFFTSESFPTIAPTVSGFTSTVDQAVTDNSSGGTGGMAAAIAGSAGTTSATWADTAGGSGYTASIISFASAVAGITLALTGVSATGAVGTVSQSGGTPPPVNVGYIPRPVLGLNGPISLAAFSRPPRSYRTAQSPNLTLNLTGVAATAALGSISAQHALGLSGASATGAVGTVGVTAGGDITLALTGVAATAALGSLAPQLSMLLVGNTALGVVGTVTSSQSGGAGGNLTLALIGVGATGVVGSLGVSGGVPVASGAVRTIFLSDVTPVPTTAVFIAGTAFAQTGEMYICPYPSLGITNTRHRGPFSDRKDGARIVSSAGSEFNRVQGISFTALNEMLVTLSQYDVVLSGVPLTFAGAVSVTAIS